MNRLYFIIHFILMWGNVYISLFNDFLLFQILLILILLLINTNIELLFIIFNSIIYLCLITCYSLLHDADILINFLLIIDLGVFFILLAFTLNFINLFTQVLLSNQLSRNLVVIFFISGLCLVVQYCISYTSYDSFTLYLQMNWFFTLIYYNWFNLLYTIYFSDLQLLSEVYFFFNLFEFVIMNIIIYVTIFIVYLGIHILYWLKMYIYYYQLRFLIYTHQHQSHYFFKIQNMQNQILVRGSTRLWLKNKI